MLPAFFGVSPLDTVHEFHNRHHGETDLDLSIASFELLQDLPDRVAPPLAGDHHAGIEN